MSSINSPTSAAIGYSSLTGLQSQLSGLQKQCADWESCATTPQSEKQKIVGQLTAQISGVEAQIQQVEAAKPVQAEAGAGTSVSKGPYADGVNRPTQDANARIGAQLNIYI